MQIEKRSDYARDRTEIKYLQISMDELFALCRKFEHTLGKPKLAKENSDQSRTILEGADEISQHGAFITLPFELRFGDIEISFRSYEVSLRYSEKDKVSAQIIAAELDSFPKYGIYFQKLWVIPLLAMIGGGLDFLSKELVNLDDSMKQALVYSSGAFYTLMLAYSVGQIFFLRQVFRPISVKYKSRATFWDRNRDTILVGILMSLIGFALGYLVK